MSVKALKEQLAQQGKGVFATPGSSSAASTPAVTPNAALYASGPPSIRIKMRALFDFTPSTPDPANQLAFKFDQVLTITNMTDYGQWYMASDGTKEGLIPSNYVKKTEESMSTAERLESGQKPQERKLSVSERQKALADSLPVSMGGSTPHHEIDTSVAKPLVHVTASRPRGPAGRRVASRQAAAAGAGGEGDLADAAEVAALREELAREKAARTAAEEAAAVAKQAASKEEATRVQLEARLAQAPKNDNSAENVSLKQEIATYKQEIKTRDDSIATLNSNAKSAKDENDKLKQDLASRDATITQLSGNAAQATTSSRAELESRDAKIAQLEAANKSQASAAQRDIQTRDDSISKLEASVAQLKAESDASKRELQTRNETIAALQSGQSNGDAMRQALASAEAATQAARADAARDLGELRQQLAAAKAESASLAERLSKAEQQAAALTETRRELDEARKRVKALEEQSTTGSNKQAADLKDRDDKLVEKSNRIQSLEAELATARSEKVALVAAAAAAATAAAAAPVAVAAATTPVSTPVKANSPFVAPAETTSTSPPRVDQTHLQLESSLGEINRKLKAEEQTKAKMDLSVHRLEGELNEFKRKLADLLAVVERRKQSRPRGINSPLRTPGGPSSPAPYSPAPRV